MKKTIKIMLAIMSLLVFAPTNTFANEIDEHNHLLRGPIELCRQCSSDNVKSIQSLRWVFAYQTKCTHGLGDRAYDEVEKEALVWEFTCYDCGHRWTGAAKTYTGREQVICSGIVAK